MNPFIIKHEYFELVKKLNHSNKYKNQETELYFFIDSSKVDHLKLFAAISKSQKILLCHKIKQSRWSESRYSQFQNLEEFIVELLHGRFDNGDLTKYIKSHIFKLTS